MRFTGFHGVLARKQAGVAGCAVISAIVENGEIWQVGNSFSGFCMLMEHSSEQQKLLHEEKTADHVHDLIYLAEYDPENEEAFFRVIRDLGFHLRQDPVDPETPGTPNLVGALIEASKALTDPVEWHETQAVLKDRRNSILYLARYYAERGNAEAALEWKKRLDRISREGSAQLESPS